MTEPLRLLIVEDRPADAELMVLRLEDEGFDPHWVRVETEEAYVAELDAAPDLILSDWRLPRFSGSRALQLVRERKGDAPFVIVSGAIGEDVAVAAMHQGADDYVPKDRLVRLGPAVRRVLDAKRLRDERRQAEVALRESEERFRGLFENTPVAILEEDFSEAWAHLERLPRDEIGDIDAYLRVHPEIVHRCAELVRVIDVNEAAVRLHEAADKDELLTGLTRTFTPESFETFRQELVAMWNGGTRLQADAVVRTLAGEPRQVAMSWAVAPGHEKRFGRVIVAVVDITERRVAENALRESENKFRQVSASAQDAIIVLDQDGRITDWNAAAEKIFGYTAPEVIGQDLHPLVVPARHRAAYRRGLRQFRKAGTGPVIGKTLELLATQRDGAEFPIELSVSSAQLRGEWHAIGMVRDITSRKRSEESLRKSESELNESQRVAHIGNWDWDADNDTIWWSEEYYRIYGFDPAMPAASYGGHLAAYTAESAARLDVVVKRAMETGEPYEVDLELAKPTPDTQWIVARGEAKRDASGRIWGMRGTAQNITERKLAEEALHGLNRELRALSHCNQALIRAEDEQRLLDDICHIVCDQAGYRMAWVGYAEHDDERTVRPAAVAGVEDDCLGATGSTWADTESGSGPTGTAIRTGETSAVQDFATDPRAAVREHALQHGHRSSIALPLQDEAGMTFGALTIVSTEPGAFTPDEIRLLEELSGDLAFGILTVRGRAERKRAEDALRKSEERLRLEVARMPIGYIVWDTDFRVVSWNPAAEEIFGFTFDEAKGRHPYELIVPPEAQPQVDDVWRRLLAGDASAHSVNENRTKDGRTILCDWTNTPLKQPDGTVLGVMSMIQDITERHLTEEKLRLREAQLREAQRIAHVGSWRYDARTAMTEWSEESYRIFGVESGRPINGESILECIHPDDRAAFVRVWTAAQGGAPYNFEHRILVDGKTKWVREQAEFTFDSAGAPIEAVGTSQDITEQRLAQEELHRSEVRYHSVVTALSEGIVLQDADGAIEACNASAEAILGLTQDQMVGLTSLDPNWRAIHEDGSPFPGETHPAMVTLRTSEPCSDVIMGVHKPDGTLTWILINSQPLLRSGETKPYAAVTSFTDITMRKWGVEKLLATEEALATALRIRAAVAESLVGLQPGQGVPEIAQAICDNVATVPHLDVAWLVHFLAEDSAIVTAVHGPPGFPLHAGQALPPARSRYLYGRAKRGPWAARWKVRAEDGEYGRAISACGPRAVAYGPILYGGTPVGLLEIGTMHGEFAQDIVINAPALAEFSAASSALLAGPFDALARRERERGDLRQIIAGGAFGPVFQPIQDLETGEVVGYEALTRFADACRPDHRFESAWSAGLGVELERATLEKAVAAATGLPAGRWLGVNMSPRLLQTPERVAEIVRRADRPVVIEVTEHEVIEDYAVIREAVRGFGPNTRISVDDAGAGAANFAHIIELHPDFVKLDIGLVRGVNVDLGRQALVIAMAHFSRTSGCRLIAEGVETEAEADTLTQLGVNYGQGYWFGRPQSVDAFAPAQPESSG